MQVTCLPTGPWGCGGDAGRGHGDVVEMLAAMRRSPQAKQFHVGLYLRWGKGAAGGKKEGIEKRERRNATQLYTGDD